MSRSARLLALMELLRRHRHPVSGADLASELGISLRTLYRDIATLQGQGAHIDGAAGLGFVLRPGFTLPPLMFGAEQAEALALGARWVMTRGDERLAAAARGALAKIVAVLPPESAAAVEASALLIGPADVRPATAMGLPELRDAIRRGQALQIRYRDAAERLSDRRIWPFALGFFEQVHVLVAWCEARASIRHFRVDRIVSAEDTGQRYPGDRHALMRQWRAEQADRAP